jgi:hypothetical protein
MSIQTMLRAAEGTAPCHQPLTMKPAAPATFIPWYKAERPVSFPSESRR